jgi:hypothetical protein
LLQVSLVHGYEINLNGIFDGVSYTVISPAIIRPGAVIANFYSGSIIVNHEIKEIFIAKAIFHYLPIEYKTDTNQIDTLTVFDTQLKKVSYENLKIFYNLEKLAITSNLIEVIDANLFDGNSQLKELNLGGNQIKFIHPNAVDSFRTLTSLSLLANYCINRAFTSNWQIGGSILSIKSSCSISSRFESQFDSSESSIGDLSNQVEQNKDSIDELRKNSNQANSNNLEVQSLRKELNNLKNQDLKLMSEKFANFEKELNLIKIKGLTDIKGRTSNSNEFVQLLSNKADKSEVDKKIINIESQLKKIDLSKLLSEFESLKKQINNPKGEQIHQVINSSNDYVNEKVVIVFIILSVILTSVIASFIGAFFYMRARLIKLENKSNDENVQKIVESPSIPMNILVGRNRVLPNPPSNVYHRPSNESSAVYEEIRLNQSGKE